MSTLDTHSSLLKLHLGCGQDYWEGYVNIDRDPQSCADQLLDLKDLKNSFPPSSASEICGYHVLNYLSLWEARRFFHDCACILAEGGALVLETVNLDTVARLVLGEHADLSQHIEGVRAIHGFGLDQMADEYPFTPHRFSWTSWHLAAELQKAGFNGIRVLPARSHALWRDMRVECIRPFSIKQ
jgi:hypothetical protein